MTYQQAMEWLLQYVSHARMNDLNFESVHIDVLETLYETLNAIEEAMRGDDDE